MIQVNYQYKEEAANDPFYPRYVVTISQYCRKIQPNKLVNIMKDYQHSNTTLEKVGLKDFKFRMATPEDMAELSGYNFNAVTPFFMKNEKLLIVLDENIANLEAGYFWMGGGRVSLKIGCSIPEFEKYVGKNRLLVANITNK